MQLYLRLCATVVLIATLTACAAENRIRVAPGSTRDSLVFLIDGADGTAAHGLVYGLTVLRCGDQLVLWTIAADGSRTIPDKVRYGQLVPGFSIRAGPEPLTQGCYQAIISSATPLSFDVDPFGAVLPRGEPRP